jgi:hypothetical protein
MDRPDDQGHAEAGGSAEHHACFSDIPAFALWREREARHGC